MPMRRASIAVIGIFLLASCGVGEGAEGDSSTLRLGYFPNVTHAPAIVGIENGILADALGSDVVLEPHAFNAGPEVVEAIFNGALDASYIGPNPAINAFAQSDGEAIRIVAGTTSGGAALVVRDGITSPDRAGRHHARDAAARQHAGRRPASMAARAGLRDGPRGRRGCVDHPAGERGRVECVRRGRDRRRLGPRAVVDAHGRGGRWARARQRGATCGPMVEFVTTHLIVRNRVPRGSSRRRQAR